MSHTAHHHAARNLITKLRGKEVMRLSELSSSQLSEGGHHSLISPFDGHLIKVSFSTVIGSDLMVIRSTNWAAEYEVRGVYFKHDAREVYAYLLSVGFVKENK